MLKIKKDHNIKKYYNTFNIFLILKLLDSKIIFLKIYIKLKKMMDQSKRMKSKLVILRICLIN